MINVLIIDDDSKIGLFFETIIKKMGHTPFTAGSIQETWDMVNHHDFDLVLLDLELPDGNGLDLLPELIRTPSEPEVIIITGTGDSRGAELAFKYGAWDYIQKPFLLEEVALPITRAIEYHREKLTPRLVPLKRPKIIGDSDAIQKALDEVGKAAATDASVLITGETGTGKELFAKAVHENSRRSAHPFIAVDCGALPDTLVESTLFGHEKGSFTGAVKKQEGLLVQAHRGTLLLDEIGDLPMNAQTSFLRCLQERSVRPLGSQSEIKVDFRVIAATHRDLDQRVEETLFRKDLLYRIRAMEIKLPPLRERANDIEEIAIKKLHELATRYNMENKAVSSEFLSILKNCPWHGNVRELINVLDYALASAGMDPTLFPKHLPPDYRIFSLKFNLPSPSLPGQMSPLPSDTGSALLPLDDFRKKCEKQYLEELIRRSQGDRKEACRISGISQSRLYALLNRYNLPGFKKMN